VEEGLEYFGHFRGNAARDLLLRLDRFTLSCLLGSNRFVKDYQVVGTFTVHKDLMLEADFDYQYSDPQPEIAAKIKALRTMEQMIATSLLLIFIYRLLSLQHQQQSAHSLSPKLRSRYLKWYAFLVLLNIVAMFSDKYAPMAAWLQLLPIF
jgi:hypothetical protein